VEQTTHIGESKMSERLDQIERLVESNARAILSLTNQSIELNTKIDRTNIAIDRTNAIIVELANVVYAVSNRQEDHEHRITRLEDRL
jgi:septal ring factor EnvC (AmiA/AmiB activator)